MNFKNKIKSIISSQKTVKDKNRRKLFFNSFQYIIISLIVILPFLSFFNIGLQGHILKTGFLLSILIFVFVIWIAIRIKDGTLIIPRSFILGSMGILAFVYLLSVLFSKSIDKSLIGFGNESGTFIAMFLLVFVSFLVARSFQSSKKIYYLYIGITLLGCVVALYEIVRIFAAKFMVSFPGTLIGGFNDFAIFFGLLVVVIVATLELSPLKRKIKGLFFGILALFLLMLSLANFYFVWAGIGIFSLLILLCKLYVKGAKPKSSKKIPVLPLVLLTISILFVLSNDLVGNFVGQTFGVNTGIGVTPSMTVDIMAGVAQNDFWFGVGPNRFTDAWLSYRPEWINQTILWNIDFYSGFGFVPTGIIMTGAVGLVAWLLFLLIFIFSGIKMLVKVRNKMNDKLSLHILFSSFFASLYMWCFALVYSLNIFNLFLAFVFMGVFIASTIHFNLIKEYKINLYKKYKKNKLANFMVVLILILLLMASIFVGSVLIQRNVSTLYYGSYAKNLDNTDLNILQKRLDHAVGLYASDSYYREQASLKLLKLGSILNSDVSKEEKNVLFQQEFALLSNYSRLATEKDPTNYLNWLSRARVYSSLIQFGLPNGYESVTNDLAEASKRNPLNPAIYLDWARLELLNDDTDSAKIKLNEALKLKPDYVEAIVLSAQIQLDEQDIDGATDLLETATIVDSNNFNLFFQLGYLKYQKQDYLGAIMAFERVLQLHSSYSNAMYFLGLSYYEVDVDNNRAITVFERVLQLNPGNQSVESIIENLKNNNSPFWVEPILENEDNGEDMEDDDTL